ncbi:hypothetical protein [Massilia niastensis]|uniref:hypothetical protein n=1 Tax=Massilia niastensis TaxID=544911 RepID=UPI00035DBA5C|nr:hypothetical protein [Massilia niastensis]
MMFASLFKRPLRQPEFNAAGLGAGAIALPAPAGCTVPARCAAVLVDHGGHTRRLGEGARIAVIEGERAWCVHPGPYTCDLAPFAQAPEIGLRVSFAIDASDPRASHHRFDLYIASEVGGPVMLDGFAQALEHALQRELEQGNLDLPPCTTLEEWNAFRSGFNQLMYSRFGVTVDDCVPVDLGAARDYARVLEARLAAQAVPRPVQAAAAAPQEAFDPAREDARALRRLFLELPCLMCALRVAVLPAGQLQFRQHQDLLRRLDLVALSVGTMPALELAAPGQPLAAFDQLRRARHSRRAALAMDDAWALLARLKIAGEGPLALLFDEADRIVSNLELDTAARRLAVAEEREEEPA